MQRLLLPHSLLLSLCPPRHCHRLRRRRHPVAGVAACVPPYTSRPRVPAGGTGGRVAAVQVRETCGVLGRPALLIPLGEARSLATSQQLPYVSAMCGLYGVYNITHYTVPVCVCVFGGLPLA